LKNSNLCDHNSPTSQTDGRTDGQTTCDRNTALCTKVHRAVKIQHTCLVCLVNAVMFAKTHYWLNVCSHWPPLALMHAWRHVIAASIMRWSISSQAVRISARSSSMSLIRFLQTFPCVTVTVDECLAAAEVFASVDLPDSIDRYFYARLDEMDAGCSKSRHTDGYH